MKKIFTLVALTVLVWGCAKKLAPVKTNVPANNTGSVINNETPASVVINNSPANNTNNSSEAKPVFTASDNSMTKTMIKPGTQSPEVMSQIAGQATFNAKCNRCHGYKVTTDYTADRWASIIAVMANGSHANLSDTEKDNVLAYVRANAKH